MNKDIKMDVRKDIRKNLRKDITELKNITVEMKNSLQEINTKLDGTEEWISNQENRIVGVTQLEDQKEKN